VSQYVLAGLALGALAAICATPVASPSGPDAGDHKAELFGSRADTVPGADPVCGTLVPEKTVAPPS